MEDLFAAGQPLPQAGGEMASASMTPSGVAPGASPPPEFDEEAVSPEEQRIYDQFVLKAKEYMTKGAPEIVAQMNNSKKPVYMNVGKTALMISEGVAKTAKAGGQEVSADIIHGAGQEVVEMLMQLGDAAGIFPFEADSQEYDEAMVMSYMHGAELAGKQLLEGPDAAKYTEEAGNIYAMQIAEEDARGEVKPEFWEKLQGGVAGGVKRALGEV